MTDQEAKIIEPLAKFHAKVYVKGRVRIISNEREFLGLADGDIVKLIIRVLDEKKRPIARAYFEGMLVSGGNVTIPKDLIQQLNIKKGDIVEVLIIDILKPKDLLGEKAKLLRGVLKGKYELLTPEQETTVLRVRA